MRVLRQVFDFYLDASIHVSLAVLSLIYITVIYFNIPFDHHLALFIFFTTIASYNFIKYGVEAEKYILVSNSYHRYIQFFSFVALGLAAYHGSSLPLKVWIVLCVLALLVGLYALPVLPQARNLRNLGLLKIFMVGFVWGGTTVILPYLAVRDTLPWDVHVEALQRLVLVLVLMLPFEIRDMQLDNPSLKTIPQRFGVAKTKAMGIAAALLFVLLTFIKTEYAWAEVAGKGLVFIILIGVMWKTKFPQKRYFSAFWVELVPVVWFFITLALEGFQDL